MSGRPERRLALALLAVMSLIGVTSTADAGTRGPTARRPIHVTIAATDATVNLPGDVQVKVSRGRITRVYATLDGAPFGSRWSVSGRTATGQVTWSSSGAHNVAVKVVLASGRVVRGRALFDVEHATRVNDPTLPRFQLVYLYPAGTQPVPGRIASISHEADVVDEWYSRQLHGLRPRFAADASGAPSVLAIESTLDAAGLAADFSTPTRLMPQWLVDGTIPETTAPIVYIEGKQAYDQGVTDGSMTCGWTSQGRHVYIVFAMGVCEIYPAQETTFPHNASYILAHEIAHALGAVSESAPHGTPAGHVDDDPRDLMYMGETAREWDGLTLDPGHDDYYLTGRADLHNIEASPLLEAG
jgi:hypothetical protein